MACKRIKVASSYLSLNAVELFAICFVNFTSCFFFLIYSQTLSYIMYLLHVYCLHPIIIHFLYLSAWTSIFLVIASALHYDWRAKKKMNQAFIFLRFRWSSGWTSVALAKREVTTSSFFLLKTASISFSLTSVSLSRACWVVDVVPACCKKNWLTKQSASESCWAHWSFESSEFLFFGLFISFYFFTCFGASIFEFLNAIYEETRVK